MAKKKTFEITAGDPTRALLADAIAQFAHAAYPPGCSDCGQMARDTLLNTAKQVAGPASNLELRVRQRSLLRQAVEWYFTHAEGLEAEQRERMSNAMLAVLRGETVDEAVFAR